MKDMIKPLDTLNPGTLILKALTSGEKALRNPESAVL
jgi:hypothetical protein